MAKQWTNATGIKRRQYECAFCDSIVGPSIGYETNDGQWSILLCPKCNKPTFFCVSEQIPAPLLGNKVESVPEEINTLYNEARACTGKSSFTAAVLACRKILMHIAVDRGAEEGKRFIEYVEYLSDNNYVPPHGKGWVDHIRQKGNEANHEIKIMSKDDALDLITFIEMLLKFIYEFPNRITHPKPTTT